MSLTPEFKLGAVSHLMLGVSDLASSLAFYCEKLGLELAFESHGFAFLNSGPTDRSRLDARQFDHMLPAADLHVHIGNTTRNAVIESQSTETDRRSHLMFMHTRDVQVANAGFYELGRSDKFDYTDPAFSVAGGEIGDLAVLWKRVLYQRECVAASAGLALTIPTGSDVRGSFPLLGTTFEVANHAVHLAPFLAYSRTADRAFLHAFAQLDVAANGNRIMVNDTMLGLVALGRLNEQSLLYLELSAGYWLYQNLCARGITGVAGMVELHYTTALQDADVVAFPALTPGPSFGGVDNRFDVPNLTVGLHIEMEAGTAIRLAGVFPLASAADDRFFSSEVQVAIIRKF